MGSSISYTPQPAHVINYEHLKDKDNLLGSDDETIRIYFVRHGESALNLSYDGVRYVQGQSPDVKLTEKGQKQAEELAQQLAPKMEHLKPLFITSTARRAIDTAAPLAALFKQPTFAHSEFLELSSGRFEGKSKKDPEYEAEYNKWFNLSARQKFSAPKVSVGESYSEVALRALEGLSKILAQIENGETLFLYSHFMLMNAVVITLTGKTLSDEPATTLPELEIENGDLLLLEIPRDGTALDGQIRSVIHADLKKY